VVPLGVPTVPARAGALKLTYWRSLVGPRGEAQDTLVQKFNESHPDVHVDVEYQGVYAQAATKLTAAISANTVPDSMLLTVDAHMPGFARAGALLSLDDLARTADPVDTSKFIPGLLENGVVDGKLYQLPLARSTPLLYYNKDAFQEAGIQEPPRTWSDLRTLGARLAERSRLLRKARQPSTPTAPPIFPRSSTIHRSRRSTSTRGTR